MPRHAIIKRHLRLAVNHTEYLITIRMGQITELEFTAKCWKVFNKNSQMSLDQMGVTIEYRINYNSF